MKSVFAVVVVLCVSRCLGCEGGTYWSDGLSVLRICRDAGQLSCTKVDASDLPQTGDVERVSSERLRNMLTTCGSTPNIRHKRWSISTIYPGTKWCGGGNTASGYNDLGSLTRTDSCCRTHDNDCAYDIVKSMKCKGTFCIPVPWTRLHCSCDDIFHACLKDVAKSGSSSLAEKTAANTIGWIYFNVMGQTCYVKRTTKKLVFKKGKLMLVKTSTAVWQSVKGF
ncbi:phospholipase A2 phaiodactylipin-like [Haliotis cracherodii]|uniref:phospholipase A2 phaiodactylipin-like n=1 Tax=Haliotis cracherodii TaxID=6455 RepID=UPI0039E85B99